MEWWHYYFAQWMELSKKHVWMEITKDQFISPSVNKQSMAIVLQAACLYIDTVC